MRNEHRDFSSWVALLLTIANVFLLIPAMFGMMLGLYALFYEPKSGITILTIVLPGLLLFAGYARRAFKSLNVRQAGLLWGGTMLYNLAPALFILYYDQKAAQEPFIIGLVAWQLLTFVLAATALQEDLHRVNE